MEEFEYIEYGYEEDPDTIIDEEQTSIIDLIMYCMLPSVQQVLHYSGIFIFWNFIFRCLTQTDKIPSKLYFYTKKLRHFTSITIGLIIFQLTIGYGWLYLIGYSLAVFGLLKIIQFFHIRRFGYLIFGFCIIILGLCEFIEQDIKLWHKIRGIQMIGAMKLISLGFDLDSGRIERLPNFIEFFGYILFPGNSILGPWIPYYDYIKVIDNPKPTWGQMWIGRIIRNMFFALLSVLLSNCIINTLIPLTSWKWLIAYRDALSFRTSNYFIIFLSQSVLVTSGYNIQSDNYYLGYQVAQPIFIELPRSIVQVVVAWNIPVHNFLKFYVFRNMRSYGTFTAILITYIVSSLLHGLNFQLAVVLLSIGFYTYVEYKLRTKLSIIFNACILPYSCRNKCSHLLKYDNYYVISVNLIFGLLAVFHLAYLGVMFEASSNIQEQGYSYEHALDKWASLDYLSHWIVAFTYLFYVLI